jgi:hypothetical protein
MSNLAARGRMTALLLHLWLARLRFLAQQALDRLDWLVQPALAFGLSRLFIFAAAFLGDTFLPTDEGHWDADPESPFLSYWAKWDSQWYVQIARDGYSYQPLRQSNVAFFPVYPLAMRLVARFTGDNLVLAGFLVSNLAFLLALVFLYRLAALELGDRAAAQRTVFYLAFFPTAFFFSSVYTESVYLLLAVAAVYFARVRFWLGAAVAGLLASATRNLGVLLVALVFWEWLRYRGWRVTQIHRAAAWRNLWRGLTGHWHELILIAAIPLGLLFYMLFLKMNYERPLAFVEVQAAWGRQNIGPVAVLLRELPALLRDGVTRGNLSRTLNVGAVLAVLGMVPFIWRRLGEGYAIYVLILLLVPLASSAMSIIRYVLPLFPVFIVLGAWGRRPALDRALLGGFAVLLGVLTTIFVNWVFVA